MFLWNEKAIQIVAGPCSVESEEQLFATARGLKKIGIQTLRGGIWKPRSRAHHFEGVGESGLRWLQRVLQELSMQVAIPGLPLFCGSMHPDLFFVRDVDVNYAGVVKGRKEEFVRLTDAIYEWEAAYGVTFERGTAVEYGDRKHIFVSGTASIDNRGEVVYPGNIAGQTRRMLLNIEALLKEAGSSLADLAKMIVYLRDIADYPIVRDLMEQQFPDVPKVIVLAPVCRPGWLIETECIAIKAGGNPEFRNL